VKYENIYIYPQNQIVKIHPVQLSLLLFTGCKMSSSYGLQAEEIAWLIGAGVCLLGALRV